MPAVAKTRCILCPDRCVWTGPTVMKWRWMQGVYRLVPPVMLCVLVLAVLLWILGTATSQQKMAHTVSHSDVRSSPVLVRPFPSEETAVDPAQTSSCTTRAAAPLALRPSSFDAANVYAAVGIISIDNAGHEGLRKAQRESWFAYKDVMKPANGYSGRLFVDYAIGLAYERMYQFSDDLLREAQQFYDILGVGIREVPRRQKNILTTGSYGFRAEVMMSLKSLAYYCYAEKTYQNAKFVIKADDDQYMRVPILLKTADMLPTAGVVWGMRNTPKLTIRSDTSFCGVPGMHVGLSRDVLNLVNNYEPVQRYGRVRLRNGNVVGSPNVTLHFIFSESILYAEDVVPPAIVDLTRNSRIGHEIHSYSEPLCRFHNHNAETDGALRYFVNPFSTIIHHASYMDQQHYMKLFPEDDTYNFTFVRSASQCYGTDVYENNACSDPRAQVRL